MTPMHRLYRPQVPAFVERVGDPFATRWRVRCVGCDVVTRPCELLSVALDLASAHAATDLQKLRERAA